MKPLVIFCLLMLWALTGCAPRPSPELDLEIQDIREQISTLESHEDQKTQEMTNKQDDLASRLETLSKEKILVQDIISGLEAEIAESSSALAAAEISQTSAAAEKLDQIMLLNGNSFSAEVKEINGDQITITLDGKEQAGKLSAVKAIRFRSGKQ